MGVAGLRHVGVRKNRRRCICRECRYLSAPRLAGAGNRLLARQALLATGFATEAAKAARDWLFERFPLPRAASFIRPDNHPSKRVAERLGAVCERTFELRGSVFEYWVHYGAGGNS
jgi:hypothetical protein